MGKRTTPLGFLPGEIDCGSHCIFMYGGDVESFVSSLASYFAAGVNAGELGVCVADESLHDRVRRAIAEKGISVVDVLGAGQVCLIGHQEVYTTSGCFDPSRALSFWQQCTEISNSEWNGLRAFGQVSALSLDRVGWMKLLEYESLLNAEYPANIGLCAYHSSSAARSYLLRAKRAHPFIANARSVRRNPSYQRPERFLSGLYRFRRVSKLYPAAFASVDSLRKDVEEIGARTPLTMDEIDDVRVAAAEAMACAVGYCRAHLPPDLRRVHVNIVAERDRLVIMLGHQASRGDRPGADAYEAGLPRWGSMDLVRDMMDKVHVGRRKGEVVIAMLKKYSRARDSRDS